jgi:hypothetical protein
MEKHKCLVVICHILSMEKYEVFGGDLPHTGTVKGKT